jgi:hypothetical protein
MPIVHARQAPGLVREGTRPAPRAPIVLAALIVLLSCLDPAVATEAPESDLAPLLDRLGRVAWLYADTALRFSCRETITVDRGSPHRYDYIYTHDKDGRFKDYRTRPGRRSGQEVNLRNEGLRRWVSQAYSWVFIFRADRRERFRFVAGDGGDVLGRPALRLDFEPIPPYEENVNDWAGTAFIDRDTWQILKVEGWSRVDFLERSSFDNALEALRTALPGVGPPAGIEPQPRYFTFETIVTEFGAEKNGMRFPSEVLIELRRYRVPGHGGREFDSAPVYQVRQAYTGYRFFSVRTAGEIRAMLSGSAPPEGP